MSSSSVSSMMLAGLVASIVVATGSATATATVAEATSATVPVSASVTSTFASSASASASASSSSSSSTSRQQQKMTSFVIPPPADVATATSTVESEDRHQSALPFENVEERRDDQSQTKKNKKSNKTKKSNKNMLRMPYIQQDELPIENVRQKWQSLSENVEFVPSDQIDQKFVGRFLEQQDNNYDGGYYYGAEEDEEDDDRAANSAKYQKIYGVEPFSYGEVEYDEYQQAWRLLGFIIDCNPLVDDDYFQNSGSGDQGTEDGCARYVLWAAYVDMEYEGGGIGEYQHWDRFNNEWDKSACEYSGSSRCAKMDCHLENTHFSLLGFFKHKSYDDWMEQLFKHEGICVWTEEEYAFMQGARETWPQGCIDSYTTAAGGENIYYNIKPIMGGDIRVGLYTDTACTEEYRGSDSSITVENIVGNFLVSGDGGSQDNYNYDFSGDSLDDSYDRWDSAFDAFHICQPCVAYDLENVDGTKFYDDDGGNGQGDMFDCYDDADYTNVNQCMKFMAKTTMNSASFRDMSLGRYQGTLVATVLSGFDGKTGSWRQENWANRLTYVFLGLASVCFLYGLVYFLRVKHETNYKPTFGWNVKEPLVMA
mmetsp:Transcript_52592/g.127410  ORF Transcript_52592/g.127410 Transcript_52592/m.127410 type:complete len:596 (+) Transcript_52592:385-2172(+)